MNLIRLHMLRVSSLVEDYQIGSEVTVPVEYYCIEIVKVLVMSLGKNQTKNYLLPASASSKVTSNS